MTRADANASAFFYGLFVNFGVRWRAGTWIPELRRRHNGVAIVAAIVASRKETCRGAQAFRSLAHRWIKFRVERVMPRLCAFSGAPMGKDVPLRFAPRAEF